MTCDFSRPPADGSPPIGRADRVVQQMTGLSRAGVRGLLVHGCVRVNGSPVTAPNAGISHGDKVEVRYDPHRRYHERPKQTADPAFDLLYEDEHLLVVNKSPHVFTVPTPTDKGQTLIAALEQYVIRGAVHTKRGRKLHVVQRLDRGVSGVLVVAKSEKTGFGLREQFAAHTPKRMYIAIVAGDMDQKKGTYRSHMATGRALQRYSVKDSPEKGELAVTHFEVLSCRHHATAVRVRLETGRRNQIRVHFAEAGHPVLGDRRYRPDLSAHPRWKAKRLALHAATLEFVHPETGRTMRFEAELPREFGPFMDRSGS